MSGKSSPVPEGLVCSQYFTLDHPGGFSVRFGLKFPFSHSFPVSTLGPALFPLPLNEGLSHFNLQVSQRKRRAENSFSSWIFSPALFFNSNPLLGPFKGSDFAKWKCPHIFSLLKTGGEQSCPNSLHWNPYFRRYFHVFSGWFYPLYLFSVFILYSHPVVAHPTCWERSELEFRLQPSTEIWDNTWNNFPCPPESPGCCK